MNNLCSFNKDTAILSGYISNNSVTKSGYYLTKNAGKTWALLDLEESKSENISYHDTNGNAWLTGSDNRIFYTNDFAATWQILYLPYESTDRIHCIFIKDSLEGIIVSSNNNIFYTNNNWKSVKEIPSPSSDMFYRIKNVCVWNRYIVIAKGSQVFYSDKNEIEWKSFPFELCNFALDIASQTLFGITNEYNVISFSSPIYYKELSTNNIKSLVTYLKAFNNSLYAYSYDGQFHQISEQKFTSTTPYTNDYKISQPEHISAANTLMWGIDENQLYLSDNLGKDWYRESELDFYIRDCGSINDQTVVLWDGERSYIYSSIDKTCKPYLHKKPLQSFLKSPLKSFIINAGTSGCFHHYYNKITYSKSSGAIFSTNNYTDSDKINRIKSRKNELINSNPNIVTYSFNEKKKIEEENNEGQVEFNQQVNTQSLENILENINQNPYKIPGIQEFNITDKDKDDFIKNLDEILQEKYISKTDAETLKTIYLSMLPMVNNIDTAMVERILSAPELLTSTTRHWFNIDFVNNNNDTLHVKKRYFVNQAWNLPWEFEFKGLHFKCYDIEFSKFIRSCLPEEFKDTKIFDNKLLIERIVRYLNEKN